MSKKDENDRDAGRDEEGWGGRYIDKKEGCKERHLEEERVIGTGDGGGEVVKREGDGEDED